MIIQISLFYLNYPADAEKMCEALRSVSDLSIVKNIVGKNVASPPAFEGAPVMADAAQILYFASEADAAAYPAGKAHRNLQEKTDSMISQVAAIDFPV